MILQRNSRRVAEQAARSQRVLALDIGLGVPEAATHVLDATPGSAPPPAGRSSVTRIPLDVCGTRWPFPDKYFDYSVCSHLLEDVRDPVAVLRELSRVARAGYIEAPSRAREIFVNARYPRLL